MQQLQDTDKMEQLYGADSCMQIRRYEQLAGRFEQVFGGKPQRFVSVSGRSELGGNHTDHQNGCVLTAAIDMDTIAAVKTETEPIIRIYSEGYEPFSVDIRQTLPVLEEAGMSIGIVRGIAVRMQQCGHETGGFSAAVSSNVLKGSGLSSSASFEILIASILNFLYNDGLIPQETLAMIGQFAENNFFKKPCGLQDQMACAMGGVSYIDFMDPAGPNYENIPFDLKKHGYVLCITNTGGCHADLTLEYAAITLEMKEIAGRLGQKKLRDCDPAAFFSRIAELRAACGDRAVLRAYHFFAENARPRKMADALLADDFEGFLRLVSESGRSSYQYLQNVSVQGRPGEQALGIGLALSENKLGNRGAWRVHGGGFAGTIQAYVPTDLLNEYRNAMESVFGRNSCYVLTFRYTGPVCIRV